MKKQVIHPANLPNLFTYDDISFIEVDGEIAMTAIELGRHLGYKDPKNAIYKLYTRYEDELAEFTGVVKLSTPSGTQKHRIFYEEGIYIVCMLAQTEKAKEFRRRVARLIRALRQQRMSDLILEAKRKAVFVLLGLQKNLKKMHRDPLEYLEDHIMLREAGFGMGKAGKFLRISATRFAVIDEVLRDPGIRCPEDQDERFKKEALPC